ncbi:hypothetical protein TrVE_jg3450 [Triparma verrucosa]|uniref:MYND-type domain-containing protein n=1 Tax=Triparma verrucosa TaxID=1606542 RepID=A0A9W7BG35_9STRA|nr:hypothetical protein TrVE_jg3450 [Triparma verrucosa]
MSCLTRPVIPCDQCSKLPQIPLRCGGCSSTFYCRRECQKAHYKIHKAQCNLMAKSIKSRMTPDRPVIPNVDATDLEHEELAQVVRRAQTIRPDHRNIDGNLEFLEAMRFAGSGLDAIITSSESPLYCLPAFCTRIEVHKYLHEWAECVEKCKELVGGKNCLSLNDPEANQPRSDGKYISEDSKDTFRMKVFLIQVEAMLELKQFGEELEGILKLLGMYLHFKSWDANADTSYSQEWASLVATDTCLFYQLHAKYFCEIGKHEECINFSETVIEMNPLSKEIYMPVAKSKRALGDLDGAIEQMRIAVKREEPWLVGNKERNEIFLKELVWEYNEELMEGMDNAEWHEAYSNAMDKVRGAKGAGAAEESDQWQLIQAYRSKFNKE